MNYKIFASLHDELNAGWVWISSSDLPSRSIVKISNPEKGKKVYCEALQIDENFLKKYNDSNRFHIVDASPSLVINSWYRKRLGDFPTQSCPNLEIKPANKLWGKIWACLHHPQVIVRIATYLGL